MPDYEMKVSNSCHQQVLKHQIFGKCGEDGKVSNFIKLNGISEFVHFNCVIICVTFNVYLVWQRSHISPRCCDQKWPLVL